MASSSAAPVPTNPSPLIPADDLHSFSIHLQSSRRILALLGAGISASSGLPTFRGPGGFWRDYDATYLATPGAFRSDPGLVWQFYSYRRHMALNAKPNRAHLALAELARRKGPEGFLTLSQNVDGLSPRAGHPEAALKLLHGSLFDVKCADKRCGYIRRGDFDDPIVPSLAIPEDPTELESEIAQKSATKAKNALNAEIAKKASLIRGADISDANIPIPQINPKDLPQCPQCTKDLLRPGVVWFGENLPDDVISDVQEFIDAPQNIDLMLVIGTSSKVWPAAGYTQQAREAGARVAVINMDSADARGLVHGDWFFQGDAGEIVPELLKSVIGEIGPFKEEGN